MLRLDRNTLPSLLPPVQEIATELVDNNIRVTVKVGADARCGVFEAPLSGVDHTAWLIREGLAACGIFPAGHDAWKVASTEAAARISEFFCGSGSNQASASRCFEDIVFDRGERGVIVSAAAYCKTCEAQRRLKTGPFAGGVHLRCRTCGAGQIEYHVHGSEHRSHD